MIILMTSTESEQKWGHGVNMCQLSDGKDYISEKDIWCCVCQKMSNSDRLSAAIT